VPDAEPSAIAVFAAELRAQRAERGWTQAELGVKIGYSGSFVSDVERCERVPKIDFARACDRAMSLPGTFERLHDLVGREAYPAWFYPVIPIERKAVRIHGWVIGAIPGLLQTEDYARSLVSVTKPQAGEDAVNRLVMSRIERQDILTSDDPPLLWYVLDESILRRMVGGIPVMAGQLDKLLAMAAMPGIIIQVMPFSAGDHAGTDGPVTVYDFPAEPSVSYTECNSGGRIIEDRREVSDMMTLISVIRASAMSPRDSAALIRRIRGEISE
jgi:transcriptional regulator with XRE-family HTH domain